jgi:hypothetical protein
VKNAGKSVLKSEESKLPRTFEHTYNQKLYEPKTSARDDFTVTNYKYVCMQILCDDFTVTRICEVFADSAAKNFF